MESGEETQEAAAMDPDQARTAAQAMWSAAAPGWKEHADEIDRRAEPMTSRMLEAAALKPGERVLELGCGPGGLGLRAAEQVGSDGEIVLSDVASEMTEIAAERAKARGIANVSTRVLDLEDVDEPDASYDAVLCREALMLVPEPDRGAAEIRRVLRPGGRAVVSVWGARERNPWLGALLDALSAQFGVPFPPAGMPGPLSLGGPGELERALRAGEFADVGVSEVEVPFRGDSFDEWWQRTTALAGPVAQLLAAQPPEVVEAIRSHAREALAAHERAEGIEIPGVTLVAIARGD